MSLFICRSKILFIFMLVAAFYFSCKKKEVAMPFEEGPLKKVTFNFTNFQSEIKPFHSSIKTRSGNVSDEQKVHPEQPELLVLYDFNKKDLYAKISRYFTYLNIIAIIKTSDVVKFINNPFSRQKDDHILEIKGQTYFGIAFNPSDEIHMERIEMDISTKSPQKSFAIYIEKDDAIMRESIQKFKQKTDDSNNSRFETITYNFPNSAQGNNMLRLYVDTREQLGKGEKFVEGVEIKVDNIRFYGKPKKKAEIKSKLNQMPYFIFDKKKGDLVNKGTFSPKTDNEQLMVELPLGNYYNIMLYHESNEPLVLPETIKNKDDFYTATSFSDKFARSFGVVDSFELKENMSKPITLKRLYSLVTFNFRDIRDLSDVSKIKIKPISPNYFWKPFNPKLEGKFPIGNSNEIEFEQDFNVDKEVVFSHFLGHTDVELPVNYEVEVWSKTRILRKFKLFSKVKNNIKLNFVGNLYPTGFSNRVFEVIIDEKWAGTKTILFN